MYKKLFLKLQLLFLIIIFPLSLFSKDVLVLLPLETTEKKSKSVLENALAQGLTERYELFYGNDVKNKLQIEYQKVDCTAESCAQNLVIHFGGELLGESVIKKIDQSYIVSLKIKNIITKQTVLSSTETCNQCSLTDLIPFLKQFGAGQATSNGFSDGLSFSNNSFGVNQAIKIENITPKVSNQNQQNTATIYFETDQNDIEVFINNSRDQVTKKGIFQRKSLQPNRKIKITLQKKNYQPRKIQFELKSGFNNLGKINLLKNTGMLDIQSLPEEAEVLIAGNIVGKTPLRIEVEAGNTIIDVQKKNYLQETFSLQIEQGKTTQRVIRLQQNIGTFIINSQPEHIEASLINLRTQEITKLTTPIDAELEAGNYQLKLYKDGFSTELFEVIIQKDKITEISKNKATLRELKGVVIVKVNPVQKNVPIRINGEEVGFAPIEKNLPEGTYLIEAETEEEIAYEKINLLDQGFRNVELNLKQKTFFRGESYHLLGIDVGHHMNKNDVSVDEVNLTANYATLIYKISFFPERWNGYGFFIGFGGGFLEYNIKKNNIEYKVPHQSFALLNLGIKLKGNILSDYGLRYVQLKKQVLLPEKKNKNNITLDDCECPLEINSYQEFYVTLLSNLYSNVKLGISNPFGKPNFFVSFYLGLDIT